MTTTTATTTPTNESLAQRLAALPKPERDKLLDTLPPATRIALLTSWAFWGRPNQQPPTGNWRVWLIDAGRGFGKTRTGAEFVREKVEKKIWHRVALVGATAADVRDIMVEGESGILSTARKDFVPLYEPSKRRLTWPNGALATLFSADEPDRLRGPQHDGAWADEIAAWRYPEAWDMLMLGLRLGNNPQCIATTTPRPTKLIRDLLGREGKDVVVTRGTTYDNRDNLAEAFYSDIIALYEGSRMGRQEIYAELLDAVEGALWTPEMIDKDRTNLDGMPRLSRIVVAVDPSWGTTHDECGIVVAGTDNIDGYVLDDRSLRATPAVWGTAAAGAFDYWRADRVIAETNFGAEQVKMVMKVVNDERSKNNLPTISFKAVQASRGKVQRAEPVLALYEQGKIHHVGYLSGLEQQMTSWVPPTVGQKQDISPDRVDALVWALTELLINPARSAATLSSARRARVPQMSRRGTYNPNSRRTGRQWLRR